MMLKRDPFRPTSTYTVEPPLYGNYVSKYRQGRRNYSVVKDKHQNTPRSDRSTPRLKQQTAVTVAQSQAQLSWHSKIPPGIDTCLQYEKSSLPSSQTKRGISTVFNQHQRNRQTSNNPQQRDPSKKNDSNKQRFDFSSKSPLPSPLDVYGNVFRGKHYYNVMWEPRVARGSTYVQFTESQRAKCKYDLDLNRSLNFLSGSNNNKRRRRNGSYFNRKSINSNPTGQTVYPDVTMKRVPLSYSAFASFLTENLEITYEDRGQSMHGDHPASEAEIKSRQKGFVQKFKYMEGESKEVQTEIEPCREDTREWIVSQLKEKIPLQALLEVAEEEELEIIRAENHRHRKIELFRKWQKEKEDQWKEWYEAWKALRLEDIQVEENKIKDLAEMMGLIAFTKNAINCSFSQTCEQMRMDGFISRTSGTSFEEIEEIEKSLYFDKEAEQRYAEKEILARKIVDSALSEVTAERKLNK